MYKMCIRDSPTTTVIIVTEEGEAGEIQYITGMDVQAGKTTILKAQ